MISLFLLFRQVGQAAANDDDRPSHNADGSSVADDSTVRKVFHCLTFTRFVEISNAQIRFCFDVVVGELLLIV